MKKLAILGASGHGKVVAEIAEYNEWREIIFFDDAHHYMNSVEGWKVEGTTQDLLSDIDLFDGVIVAIGSNSIRLEKTNQLLSVNANLVSLAHPTAVVSKYSSLGTGSVVMAQAVINPFSRIGTASIVNTSSSIDHDCNIGVAVHVSPGANIAGNVEVGDFSWIGIGSSVKQNTSIGKNVIVGAGAVVVSNVPDDVTVAGVPATKIIE